jgi:hypothetical protein
MNIVRPREPRSPLDLDAICPIHAPGGKGSKHFTAPAADAVRSWVMTKSVGGLIASGTSLRLDSVQHGGAYLHDGAWSAVTRRFCVLDGPMAGTCWDETEWTSQFDDAEAPGTRSAEPVLASPGRLADRP